MEKESYMSPAQMKSKDEENDFFNRVKEAKDPDWERRWRFILSCHRPLANDQSWHEIQT